MRNQPTTREIRNARIKLKAKMRLTHILLTQQSIKLMLITEKLGKEQDLTNKIMKP